MIWMMIAVALWIVAVAFAGSDVFMLMALFHFRGDRRAVAVCMIALAVFALVCAGAVWAALAVGRNATW